MKTPIVHVIEIVTAVTCSAGVSVVIFVAEALLRRKQIEYIERRIEFMEKRARVQSQIKETKQNGL